MLYNTTMLIDPVKYPQGFVLVISASPTDDLCNVVDEANQCDNINGDSFGTEVTKNITITLSANSEEKDYLIGTFVISGVYFLIFVVSSLISAHVFRYDYNKFEDLLETIKMKMMFKQEQESKRIKTLSMLMGGREKGLRWLEYVLKEKKMDNSNGMKNTLEIYKETDEVLEPVLFIDIDELDNIGIDLNDESNGRLKHDLTLADLSNKIDDQTQSKSMYDKSDLHWVVLIIVSVYYSLPTIQMVLDSNNEYEETGSHDLCY